MTEATPLYVPVGDAPALFSISRATIYRAAKAGKITIHKPTNRPLLKVSEVVKWIEGND